MSPLLLAALVGFVGGPVGALTAVLLGATVLRNVRNSTRGAMLAFAGGFILAVAFTELVRRGLAQPGGWWAVALTTGGLAAGAGLRDLVSRLVGRVGHGRGRGGGDNRSEGQGSAQAEQSEARGQAYQIATSLAVINLLEGLPVGIGFAVDQRLGVLIGAIMVFENFTEALSVSTELSREEERHLGRLVALGVTPTLTLGVGAGAGVLLGELPPLALAGLLGAAAGIMLYAVADDIVYDAHRLGQGAITTLPLLVGIIVGVVLVELGAAEQSGRSAGQGARPAGTSGAATPTPSTPSVGTPVAAVAGPSRRDLKRRAGRRCAAPA